MINTIKNQYKKLSSNKRILLEIVLVLVILTTSFFGFLRAATIPFDDTLGDIFDWLDRNYYSDAHFNQGGNNFVGIFFWQTGETLSTPENITIGSGTVNMQSINCSTRVRGIYYNNQRGRTIWPLNSGNLNSSYVFLNSGSISINGGFYTNCTGITGYTPAANEIYGQITHIYNGSTGYNLFAGLRYDLTGNSISGASFDHTLALSGGIYNGYIFDTYGGIAELNTFVPYCNGFSVTPTVIQEGNQTIFTCNGTNVTGYLFSILDSGGSNLGSEIINTSDTSYMYTTGINLPVGNYYATCSIMGNNTHLGGAQCGEQIPFEVTGTTITPPSGTGCSPNFQGTISFSSLSGSTVTNPSLGTYYSNSTGILLQRAATAQNSLFISGDFSETPLTGNYTGTDIFNHLGIKAINLLYTNEWNYFYSTFSTGNCMYTGATKRIFIDTIPPTTPTITTPTNNAYICPSIPLSVQWTASTDAGSQLSHYTYKLYDNSGLTTGLVLSGTSTNNELNLDISYLPLGRYYLSISAIDNVGLSTISTTVTFTTSQSYCPVGTGIMIVSPIISIENADLDTAYRSDPIYIMGLTEPTLLSISSGMLFINSTTGGVGTTGMITSHDTIYIELISSNQYDSTISSTLNILGYTGEFSIHTKNSNCMLSAGEKLVIQNLYQNLKNNYNNDISKLADFLHTFQSMVNDEATLTNSCTLEYLLRLIEEDLGFNGGIDTSNHITPNCKEYHIEYDISQQAYSSTEMMKKYYFINRESLIRHLDYYNPGDCHINTYGDNTRAQNSINDPMRHIAPNGKIYTIIGQYGGFSAQEFISPKYFDSLEAIKTYIDIRNPAKTIWNHEIDTSFFPIVYAAPNGKEYKVYKTNRGYMSYKLMKVQYFSNLSEIKHYVDKNNPSKR